MPFKISVATLAGVLTLLFTTTPALAAPTWQAISTEPGKRVEIDRSSIKREDDGKVTATSRIVLEKPINDPKTSSYYRIIEALNRYDCGARVYGTLLRRYFKEEGDLLREEEAKGQNELPARSGSLDDRLLREVCRPKGDEARVEVAKLASKTNQLTGGARAANKALVEKEVRRTAAKPTRKTGKTAAKPPKEVLAHVDIHWAYDGEGGPANWGKLKPEYSTCDTGSRQSPVDIRDGIRVDLEPIQFHYRTSRFRLINNGHTIQAGVDGNSISLLGKNYELIQFHFHRPAEERVNGKTFPMVAHLVHRSEEGKLAVVALFLEKGRDHPVIQTLWNHLPLEKNEVVQPPMDTIDVGQLLPDNRNYYTYMGSLTTPPCTEGVLWLVLKQPQQISSEQMAIFARLYPHNARPIQPTGNRLVKESR